MPVSHDKKLCLCHIPRTGGVSVANALKMFDVKDKHFKASWYREHYPDYKLFTIIRPYDDRIKSAFGWKLPERRKGESSSLNELVELVKAKGAKNIGLMLQKEDYFLDCEVDFKLRFEYLQEDLNKMLIQLGQEPVKLVQVNSFR
jgi:hypothetical protein